MDSIPIINIKPGTESFVREYLDNRKKDCELIKKYLTNGEFENIRTLGHKMRGSGGVYGFSFITEVGYELEKAAVKKDHAGICKLQPELSKYIVETIQSVSRQLGNTMLAEKENDGSCPFDKDVVCSDAKGHNVLIVEDDASIAEILKNKIKDAGIAVKGVLKNREEFVSYMQKGERPDVIILDLYLEDFFGTDMLGDVYSKWKETEVYIFTANSAIDEAYPYLRDLTEGFYLKNEIDALVEKIASGFHSTRPAVKREGEPPFGGRILIADDDPDILKLLQGLFSKPVTRSILPITVKKLSN